MPELIFLGAAMPLTGAVHDETIKWGAYTPAEQAMINADLAAGRDVYG